MKSNIPTYIAEMNSETTEKIASVGIQIQKISNIMRFESKYGNQITFHTSYILTIFLYFSIHLLISKIYLQNKSIKINH